MNYSHHVLFAKDLTADDEIDNLFSQLQQIAPPSSLVENILASVARLTPPICRTAQNPWENIEFVVHHEDREPS